MAATFKEPTMPLFDTTKLSAPNRARFEAAMAKLYRYSDGVRSLGAELERAHSAGELVAKKATDGMIDWKRTKFNRMDGREQAAYEARLKAKRYYWIETADGSGTQLPKLAFDACTLPVHAKSLEA